MDVLPDIFKSRFITASTLETDEERKQADRRFTSSDQRQAFRSLTLSTFDSGHEELLHYKKATILDVRKKKAVDQDIVRNYDTVYIGSDIDIGYSLCLGSRKVILVDPIFSDHNRRDHALEQIAYITGEQPKRTSDKSYSFFFDFGSGKEEASVTFEQEPYASKKEFSPYNLPQQVGMILSFLTPSGLTRGHNLDAQAVRDNLVAGGMILVFGEALDEAVIAPWRDAYARKKIKDEKGLRALASDRKAMKKFMEDEMRAVYKQYGYTSIPLSPFIPKKKEALPEVMTFLKKE